MKRLSLIPLILSLTALIAWGCNSGQTTSPSIAPTPGDNLTDQTPDLSPDLNDNDFPPTAQIGGGTPPVPSNGGLDGTESDAEHSTRTLTHPMQDCDGKNHFVSNSSRDSFLDFPKKDAAAINANRTVVVIGADKSDVDLTLTSGSWADVTGLGGNDHSFNFNSTGTYTVEDDRSADYYTNFSLAWTINPRTTCLTLDSITATHSGPRGVASKNIVFEEGLRLAADRFRIRGDERYAALAKSEGGEEAWIAEVVSIENLMGREFITYQLRTSNSLFRIQFVWNNQFGMVSVCDPFLQTDNGDVFFTFPGYPHR